MCNTCGCKSAESFEAEVDCKVLLDHIGKLAFEEVDDAQRANDILLAISETTIRERPVEIWSAESFGAENESYVCLENGKTYRLKKRMASHRPMGWMNESPPLSAGKGCFNCGSKKCIGLEELPYRTFFWPKTKHTGLYGAEEFRNEITYSGLVVNKEQFVKYLNYEIEYYRLKLRELQYENESENEPVVGMNNHEIISDRSIEPFDERRVNRMLEFYDKEYLMQHLIMQHIRDLRAYKNWVEEFYETKSAEEFGAEDWSYSKEYDNYYTSMNARTGTGFYGDVIVRGYGYDEKEGREIEKEIVGLSLFLRKKISEWMQDRTNRASNLKWSGRKGNRTISKISQGAEEFGAEQTLYWSHKRDKECSYCGYGKNHKAALLSDDGKLFSCYKCNSYPNEEEMVALYDAEEFGAEYKVIGIPEGHWEYDVINRQIEKGDRDDEMNHRVVARDVNRNDGRLITYLHNEALQRFENMGRDAESFEATKGMDTYAQPLEELKIKPTKTKVGILLASIVAGGLWYSNKMKE
tara:strand:- start:1142 stop:2713 length:1572 start_codon:yes stop_codon:yes gene_type:complete